MTARVSYRSLRRRSTRDRVPFGAIRPYGRAGFLAQPHRLFRFLLPVFTGEDHADAAHHDHFRGIEIRVFGMTAALADKRGLIRPIVRVSMSANGTLLR